MMAKKMNKVLTAAILTCSMICTSIAPISANQASNDSSDFSVDILTDTSIDGLLSYDTDGYYDDIFVMKLMDTDDETYFKVPKLNSSNARSINPFMQPAYEGSATAEDTDDNISARTVFGSDDRSIVKDTTQFPFRAILLLEITFPNGFKDFGTAWMIGPAQAVTAAHCVYRPICGGWASDIRVSPGRNNSVTPYGTQRVYSMSADSRYTNGDTNHDYAVIGLSEQIGLTTGFLGYQAASDNLINTAVTISGYPDPQVRLYRQYFMRDTIRSMNPFRMFYQIDTEEGQSGSPIYNDLQVAVGIHTTGGEFENSGIRISEAMVSWFNSIRYNPW